MMVGALYVQREKIEKAVKRLLKCEVQKQKTCRKNLFVFVILLSTLICDPLFLKNAKRRLPKQLLGTSQGVLSTCLGVFIEKG